MIENGIKLYPQADAFETAAGVGSLMAEICRAHWDISSNGIGRN